MLGGIYRRCVYLSKATAVLPQWGRVGNRPAPRRELMARQLHLMHTLRADDSATNGTHTQTCDDNGTNTVTRPTPKELDGVLPSHVMTETTAQMDESAVGMTYDTNCEVVPEAATRNTEFQHDVHRLTKYDLRNVAKAFLQRPNIWAAVREEGPGLEDFALDSIMKSFTKLIRMQYKDNFKTRPQLKPVVAGIVNGSGHIDDLFPFFMAHARQQYPLLFSTPELDTISDLTSPAKLYLMARVTKRRLIYHAGPTNSGKTHHALQAFLKAETAVYCSPLRMLANEICHRANQEGVPCDLLTGETKFFASGSSEKPANHLACTVEMASTNPQIPYDVAIIDEVQMISDEERGAAWTRAVLGLPAHEVHMCGHECALNLVQRLAKSAGEKVEVVRYKRLVPLVPLNRSLGGRFERVRPGDCVVVFSRRKIYTVRRQIEAATREPCALVYGGLPPATRLEQAELFNSNLSRTNILVATDAIGMGMNLNIRRIVFYDLEKYDGGEKKTLTSAHVKQIAGRAGRYGKDHPVGEVTTFHAKDIDLLHKLLRAPESNTKQAGISPTLDQIDVFSSYFPGASLQEILAVFFHMVKLDGNYFLSNVENTLEIAGFIRDIPMSIRDMFHFSLSPVNLKKLWLMNALHKFATAYSEGEKMSFANLCDYLQWPLPTPRSPGQLLVFENIYEALDLYRWLGMRFPELFVAMEEAREIQDKIEDVIGHSITSRFHHKKVRTNIKREWNGMETRGVQREGNGMETRGVQKKIQLLRKATDGKKKDPVEKKLVKSMDGKRKGAVEKKLVKSGRISTTELKSLKTEWEAGVVAKATAVTRNKSKVKEEKNPTSVLLEIFQGWQCPPPSYEPSQKGTFQEFGTMVTITLRGGKQVAFHGKGKTKKLSKADASQAALDYLRTKELL